MKNSDPPKIETPIDRTAERMVLSSVINSVNAANELLPVLTKDDFFTLEYMNIFTAMKIIYDEGKEINISTTAQKLKELNLYEKAGGNGVILDLLVYSPNAPYKEYFTQLRKVTNLRLLMINASQLIKDCTEPNADSDQLIKSFQDTLLGFQGASTEKIKNISEIAADYVDGKTFMDFIDEGMEKRRKGLPVYDGVSSGFNQLDDTLGSFKRSCLYYIGARTSMGKTTLLTNFFVHLTKNNIPALFFSLEMSSVITSKKLFSMYCDIPSKRVDSFDLSYEERERLLNTMTFLQKENISLFIDDERGMTIDKLQARAKRYVKNHGVQIIFIDYLTCIRGSRKHPNKHLEVDEISKGLQTLAQQLNVPIVCLCQLNRQVTTRSNPTPTLADFRESGSIEEDADACLLLHRPDYYDPTDKPGITQLIVAKNRMRGVLGKLEFVCNPLVSERYHEAQPLKSLMPKEVSHICGTPANSTFDDFTPKD